MVRSGKWPLRTTWRRPAASRQSWWRSIQSATSASMAWASSCWAPWRRRSVRTSWAWGSDTIRVSVVASIMVAYSCAALAGWWTFDTPEYAAFSHPAIHNIRSYPAPDPGECDRAVAQSAIRNPQSAIKITDFGLAKFLRDEAAAGTRSGALVGTPRYMAPEQVKKELGAVGPHTDVYALGVILYDMLTGRAPFEGDSEFEVLTRVVADEPPPPSLLRPRVHRDLETVCLKCLAREPGRRYARARQLADG